MEFIFLTAHKVLGITHKPTDPDLVLFEGTDPHTKVLVTGSLDCHWYVLDREVGLRGIILQGLIGQAEFSERLEQEIQAIRGSRSKAPDSGGVLLIEIRGNIDAAVKGHKHENEDFILCFDAYDKKELQNRLQHRVAAILAAVRIGGNGKYELESIGSGSYLIRPDGKIVHSLSVEYGTPTIYTSAAITDEQVTQVKKDIDLILKEKELRNVVRLFAHSLDRNTDGLRTFISAWSAMEIFIGKIFQKYEDELVSELSKISAAPGLKQYLGRITDVMEGKYTLVDKFAVISIFLDRENETNDIAKFKKIKRVRDDMFHGKDVPEASLPNKELHHLFEKYFRNYIRGNA